MTGKFFFVLNDNYDGTKAVMHLLDDTEKYEIVINDYETLNTSEVDFVDFYLEENMKDVILERSIHNQIENNYFSFKPDSVRTLPEIIPFYGDVTKEYLLDDYTRFPTFEETIVEILENVYVKGPRTNNPSIQIRPEYLNSNQTGFNPLIIVDGNFIEDFSELLQYNARKIEKINVFTDQYILGPQVFQGLLDIVTFDGDYSDSFTRNYSYSYNLFKPLSKKYYFNQRHDEDSSGTNGIPDYRHQLFWNPHLEMKDDSLEITLYTSDVSGDFEISLEGFSSSGKPISARKFLTVK